MSRAFRCEVCDGPHDWRITRCGDAALSWACNPHLAAVCTKLQRDWEVTELVVVLAAKAREWAEITTDLDTTADEFGDYLRWRQAQEAGDG